VSEVNLGRLIGLGTRHTNSMRYGVSAIARRSHARA
jgi:hypothetical protein